MQGRAFVASAAQRIIVLLQTLDHLRTCVKDGERTAEGNRLYQDHFTGDKAWFSDSSDTEVSEFADALTFKHPARPGETILCRWHGKVKTPQIRIHFTWPVSHRDPLYVVYIGPKLTIR
jgi:hypothetical protein